MAGTHPMADKSGLWFARIVIGIGLALVALASVGVVRQGLQGGSETTTGAVVRLVAAPTSFDPNLPESQRRYADCPVVRFTTREGSEHEVQAATCASPPNYTVGETVPVSYDPDRPERAAVGGFFTRHMLAVVCAGFAVPFLLIGLFVRRSTRRALAEAAELSRRGT
jgi:hypothetical protein